MAKSGQKKRRDVRQDAYSIEEVVDALHACNGSRMDAADILGCDERTIWLYSKKYPRVEEALEDCDRLVGNLARNVILDGIMSNDKSCAMFYLKTRGGWSERREISGVDKGPIEQNVTIKADTPPAANSIEEWIEVRKRVQAARAEVVEAAE